MLDFMWKIDWSKVSEFTKNIFTILGIIVGGLWAYYNFFKGRIYRPKLELKISGSFSQDNEVHYLLATLQLKNVGLSEVIIHQKGSGLRVFSFNQSAGTPESSIIEWERFGTFSVFEEHEWIESGEIIEDQIIIPVPPERTKPFKTELTIVSKKGEWNAKKIIK
jgi:hypothetical protein